MGRSPSGQLGGKSLKPDCGTGGSEWERGILLSPSSFLLLSGGWYILPSQGH